LGLNRAGSTDLADWIRGLPKTSMTQISAERSGRSSRPDIQNATIERGDSTARIRTSTWP
jgi:hypothetical protein